MTGSHGISLDDLHLTSEVDDILGERLLTLTSNQYSDLLDLQHHNSRDKHKLLDEKERFYKGTIARDSHSYNSKDFSQKKPPKCHNFAD